MQYGAFENNKSCHKKIAFMPYVENVFHKLTRKDDHEQMRKWWVNNIESVNRCN